MKDLFRFKAIVEPDIPERRYIIDEKNFLPRHFIGFDGIVYENYGTEEKPVWENIFDALYDLEIILKTQKMIIDDAVYDIKINQNPTIILNEKINDDGSKELCGNQKWLPLKFEFIGNYDKSINKRCDEIIISGNDIFRLKKCYIDFENNEIIFERSILLKQNAK